MTVHVWRDFLAVAQHEVGSRVVETWLKAIELVRFDARQKVVFLRAPNAFVKDWVSANYTGLFIRHLSRLCGVDAIQIVFLEEKTEVALVIPARLALKPEQETGVSRDVRRTRPVNTTYQFETFVVGPSNALAYAAAVAVAEKPGAVYNPLFIYGSSGLGKTHLLHAIGNEVKKRHKKMLVLYQPADRFVNEFIHAIRFDKVDIFKEKYKKVDVLLVDDIQFFAHKGQTQEAFFHVFNALYESSKQIVCTSDTYPRDLRDIAERLRSRLEWGLVTDVQSPTIEEKIAILKRKAILNEQPVADDIAQYVANQTTSNVRELEGALVRVCAFASLTHQPLTLDLVKRVLGRVSVATEQKNITLEMIANTVAKHYGYTLSDLRSPSRNKDISFSRHVAMFVMKKITEKSLQEIGLFLRRSDHTTVAHAIDKVGQMASTNEPLNALLGKIEKQIRAL